jgi:hypothetical protein
VQEAVLLPSAVVTVMTVVPAAMPVTEAPSPLELTVATELLLLDQVTFWFVALDGVIVAVTVTVFPTTRLVFETLRVTALTLEKLCQMELTHEHRESATIVVSTARHDFI